MKTYLTVGLFIAVVLAVADAGSTDKCDGRCGDSPDPAYDCNCNSACSHYGDCCGNYMSICGESCTGRCGESYYPGNPCNCNDECTSYGNCCGDYGSLCANSDSCAGRCGDTPDASKTCQCNSVCSSYGDCCSDYQTECVASSTTTTTAATTTTTAPGGTLSCQGRCGENYNPDNQCHCNDQCSNYGNCCSDYNNLCDGPGNTGLDMNAFATKMWELDENRIDESHWTIDKQNEKSSSSDYTDIATRPLFSYFDEAYIFTKGTFASYSQLCNLYKTSQGQNEDVTPDAVNQVDLYLDEVIATPLMKEAITQLEAAGYVTGTADFRAKTRRAFFELYSRTSSTDSSGFEHCFCGEFKSSTKVNGFHNWVTFYQQEKQNRLNYHGNFGLTQPDHLGVQFDWDNRIKPLTSIMLGVSTEFELAIYMACFFKNPGGVTSFTITDGGSTYPVKVQIYTHNDGTQIGSAYFIS